MGSPLKPQSWNRYQYALNNPLGYVDPTGLVECGATGQYDCQAIVVEEITVSAHGTTSTAGQTLVLPLPSDAELQSQAASGNEWAQILLGQSTVGAEPVGGPIDFLISLGTGVGVLRGGAQSALASSSTRPLARSLGAAGDDLLLQKAVNSNLPHAVERGLERGVFSSLEEGGMALRGLSADITRTGTFPAGTLADTARKGRFLVPVGDGGMAVYQLGRNGTAKLKTVLTAR